MGVAVGEADGDFPVLAKCENCENEYETDETMGNDCPHCGYARFEVLDGYSTDPELSWREDGDAR